jgi:hypothetical protein
MDVSPRESRTKVGDFEVRDFSITRARAAQWALACNPRPLCAAQMKKAEAG